MIIQGVEARPVPGFEGVFWVSRDGRVAGRRGRWLTPSIDKAGYHRACTMVDGKGQKVLIHRAVLSAWGPRPSGEATLHVHHKDFSRANNDISNLEWVTQRENNAYSREAGRHSIAEEKNPKSKLTAEMVLDIRRRHREGAPIAQLVQEFPVNWCSVWRVVTFRSWKDVK